MNEKGEIEDVQNEKHSMEHDLILKGNYQTKKRWGWGRKQEKEREYFK